MGAAVVERAIVPDEREQIAAALSRFADETEANLVLTTGGTGFTARDVTPEATLDVLDRQAPGFAEAMRAGSLAADAARDAVARRERAARAHADRQHAGQPARLSRAVRDDRAGAAARDREAARPRRGLRDASSRRPRALVTPLPPEREDQLGEEAEARRRLGRRPEPDELPSPRRTVGAVVVTFNDETTSRSRCAGSSPVSPASWSWTSARRTAPARRSSSASRALPYSSCPSRRGSGRR